MQLALLLAASSFWTGPYFSFFLVIVGFGLVVFFHELGHFLVAKRVGIKVEEFAIGFGRRLWSCRRGETEYRLNVLPLGGYVKMLGQEDFKPKAGEEADPRAYNNRPIWARIAVVSAGVVMNVLLAGLLFFVVFLIGIRFEAPVVGSAMPGYPAATVVLPEGRGVGLKPGDRIEAMDGREIHKYTELQTKAILSGKGHTFDMRVSRPMPDGTNDVFNVKVATVGVRTETGATRPQFGVGLAVDRVFADLGESYAQTDLGYVGDASFQAGDVIIRFGGQPIEHGWQVSQATERLTAEPVDVVVKRGDQEVTVRVRPTLTWSDSRQSQETRRIMAERDADGGKGKAKDFPPINVLGLMPRAGVSMLQPGSPAAKAGLQAGDILVKFGDQGTIPTAKDMPFQLLDHVDKEVPFWVLRDGKEVGPLTLIPKRGTLTRHDEEQKAAPIGVVTNIETDRLIVADVLEGSPLAGQIDSGFEIKAVDEQPVSTWPQLIGALADRAGQAVVLHYSRPGGAVDQTQPIELTESVFRASDYGYEVAFPGLLEHLQTEPFQTYNPLTAFLWGTRETGSFIVQTYATLRSFLMGRVSGKEFSGPVGIVMAGMAVGKKGVVWIIYLMAIISANLAVINFLPLPIVDGGHVVFLLIEKVRRKPLSVRIQNAVQAVGLALLLVAFVLLTYNDIVQWLRYKW